MGRDRWWIREIERRERDWAAERAQLVTTICRLAGKGLPAEPVEPRPVDDTPAAERWTPSPEQLPVD
jgi:hypothetical protein